MLSEDPAERAAAVYDAVSSSSMTCESSGGGFLVSDSLAGGFLHDVPGHENEQGSSREMKVSALPRALEELGLHGSQREEVQELLESTAERNKLYEEPVIPKAYFIEAVQAVLGATRRLKRRRRTARFDGDSESDVSNAASAHSDEFTPSEEIEESSYDEGDEDEGEAKPARRNLAPKPRLTKARKEQARLMYRLLLERIPLVAPTMLETYSYKGVRTDVTEQEIDTRRIGIDELRFAARSLGESPSTTELAEMLYEAEALSAGHPNMHTRPNTQAPRIGLHEYVRF